MGKNKYKESDFEIWWGESQAWKFMLGFIIGMLFISIVVLTHNPKEEDLFEDFDWEEARAISEYKESTMKLVKKTGVPEEYSCEDLKFMISTGTIPPKILVYHCKSSPDIEMRLCERHTNPNNQQEFKDYFILNCLEVISHKFENGK